MCVCVYVHVHVHTCKYMLYGRIVYVASSLHLHTYVPYMQVHTDLAVGGYTQYLAISTCIGYYPGKRVTSVLLHEEWMHARGESQGQHSSPMATKLMLHAFLVVKPTCFILLHGNSKVQINLLVNCLKAHVTSLLVSTYNYSSSNNTFSQQQQ